MNENVTLLVRLKRLGIATEAQSASGDGARDGWITVASPTGEDWLIARDVQPFWSDFVHLY